MVKIKKTTMSQYIVYVYKKSGKHRVLTHEQVIAEYLNMEKEGWQHIETLDACDFIQNTLNKELNTNNAKEQK
jgi:hypothetical protein